MSGETDEEMAARLQNEELAGVGLHQAGGGHGGAGGGDGAAMPILQRLQPRLQREDNRVVHANVAANLQDVREHSPRVFAVYVVTTVIEVITTAIILGLYWGASCDKNLQLWLLIFTSRQAVVFPLNLSGYLRHRPRAPGGPPQPSPHAIAAADAWEQKVKAWVNFLTFVWFIVGQSWVYSTGDCRAEAPALYTYCLILIVLVYVSLAFPIILLLCLCLCFPCVLLFFRLFAEPAGAQPQVIQNLPSRVFEAPPPRRAGEPAVDPASCAICMENYNAGDRLRDLPCRHSYHDRCVDTWLAIHDTCPLCRHRITDPAPPPPASANANATAGTAGGRSSSGSGSSNSGGNKTSGSGSAASGGATASASTASGAVAADNSERGRVVIGSDLV